MQINSSMCPDEPNTAVIRRIFRIKNRAVPKFENRTIRPTRCHMSICRPPFSATDVALFNHSNVKKSFFEQGKNRH